MNLTPEIRQSHVYVLVEWAKAAPDTTGCAYLAAQIRARQDRSAGELHFGLPEKPKEAVLPMAKARTSSLLIPRRVKEEQAPLGDCDAVRLGLAGWEC